MRYPQFLKDNDCIGFVAPSFGCATEPYKSGFINAQKKLSALGYKLNLGPNCYESAGIGISNTPEKCGAELKDYYVNQPVDALISCGGGELMCEVVDYIDFEGIAKATPKWYVGYSDNTNFTFLSTTLADTAAIYGPCAATFGMEPWHPYIQDTLDLLAGRKLSFTGYPKWEYESLKSEDNPLATLNTTEESIIKTYPGNSLSMKGRLIGGCLDSLSVLVGTKYDKVKEFIEKYEGDGIIWFLEACELNPMGIRRALWNLDRAGWFKHASGFIIGRPMLFGEECMGLDQYNSVTGILGAYDVPILMDADIGHLPPMIPIISGCMATVEAEDNDYTISYELR